MQLISIFNENHSIILLQKLIT